MIQHRSLHPNIKILLSAWQRMKLEPSDTVAGPCVSEHPGLISRLFVLQDNPDEGWLFRNLGDDLQDLLGQENLDTHFSALWRGPDQRMLEATLDSVSLNQGPALIHGRAETLTGRRLELEILLAPLSSPERNPSEPARILGLYQTLGGDAFISGRRIYRHVLTRILPPPPMELDAGLRLVVDNQDQFCHV